MSSVDRVGIKERSAAIIIFRVGINAGVDKKVKFINISAEVKLVTTEDIASFNRGPAFNKEVSDIGGRTDEEWGLSETIFGIDFSTFIEEEKGGIIIRTEVKESALRVDGRDVNVVGEIGKKIREEFTTINNIFKFKIGNFLIVINFREDSRNFRSHSIKKRV